MTNTKCVEIFQVEGNSTRPLFEYTFEITTSFFAIDTSTGHLVVNQPDLDRDPPATGKLGFQIFARESSDSSPGLHTNASFTI